MHEYIHRALHAQVKQCIVHHCHHRLEGEIKSLAARKFRKLAMDAELTSTADAYHQFRERSDRDAIVAAVRSESDRALDDLQATDEVIRSVGKRRTDSAHLDFRCSVAEMEAMLELAAEGANVFGIQRQWSQMMGDDGVSILHRIKETADQLGYYPQ